MDGFKKRAWARRGDGARERGWARQREGNQSERVGRDGDGGSEVDGPCQRWGRCVKRE